MLSLCRSDWYRLRRDKYLAIVSGLILIFGLISIVFRAFDTGREMYSSEVKEMVNLAACAIYAGLSIGAEFARRTIQRTIIAGHSRSKIIFSKLAAYFCGCFILMLLNNVINCLIYSLFYGWGNPIVNSEIHYVLKSFTYSTVFHICTLSLVFAIVILIKDPGISTTVAICVVVFIIAYAQGADSAAAYALADGLEVPPYVLKDIIIKASLKLAAGISATVIIFEKSELK